MLMLLKEITGINQKKRDRLVIIKHELKKVRAEIKQVDDKLNRKPISTQALLNLHGELDKLLTKECKLEGEEFVLEQELK